MPPASSRRSEIGVNRRRGLPHVADAEVSELAERYLRVDEDRDTVLRELPWPFLGEDNRCVVYEVRPKACREYPRADQKGMQRLLGIAAKNALLCPAAFLVTQELRRAVSPRG